jgi:hypothetical protein
MNRIQQWINTMPSHRARRSLKGIQDHRFGEAVPESDLKGYKPGSVFTLENAILGQSMLWVNIGTEAACLFVPFGPVVGYGIAFAGGPVDLEDAAALTTISLPGVIQQDDMCYASHCITDDNGQFRSIAPTAGHDSLAITVNASNPTDNIDAYYCGVRNKCTPEYDIVFAGEYPGDADDDSIAITIAGLLATDMAFVTPLTTDDADTIDLVVCTANTLTITVSADPLSAHTYSYMVLRKRGTFKPSHYIAYAGEAISDGGDTAETEAVSGVLATDIVISQWAASNDNDCFIEAAIASEDLITWETTNDPVSTEHTFNYLVLRAY